MSVGLLVAAALLVSPDLEEQVAELDAILFERGFNACELEAVEEVIAEDLEFFHDLGGRNTGRESFMGALEQNICADGLNPKPMRRLVGTFDVFPLRDGGELYGVIQTGEHAFYLGDGPEPEHTSTARFTHVWLLRDEGQWQLSRVLSYDHQTP